MCLMRAREDEILPKLRCIAFTDSVHSVLRKDPPAVKGKNNSTDIQNSFQTSQYTDFIVKHAKNWVQSDKPLDTLEKKAGSANCEEVSAGHPKHENTSSSAIESVFRYLKSYVGDK